MDEIYRFIKEEVEKQFFEEISQYSVGKFYPEQATYSSPNASDVIFQSFDIFGSHKHKNPIQIHANNSLTDIIQYRFPKRKCKRLVKKFAKRYTKQIPSRKIFYNEINNTIICHPIMKNEIIFALKTNKEPYEWMK